LGKSIRTIAKDFFPTGLPPLSIAITEITGLT
jgi:hypothetical protein